MIKISADLRRALASWRLEATSKKPPREVQVYGLCHYVTAFGFADASINYELKKAFSACGLNNFHPFDNLYEEYCEDDNKHLNPKRLAWVNKVLEANP